MAPWLHAIRPKTLPAAAAPVIVGTGLAARAGDVDWFIFFPTLLAALCIQVVTNLVNDAADFERGADSAERIGPLRVTAAGLLTVREVKRMAAGVTVLALVLGLYLVSIGGVAILTIGLASLLFAYLYTAGPFPLAYLGLGELFVFIFFGPVAVAGTYLLQRGDVSSAALASGTALGLLSCVILAVNNLRDAPSDARAGKRTLAVRWGRRTVEVGVALGLGAALFLIPIAGVAAGWWREGALVAIGSSPVGVTLLQRLRDAAQPEHYFPLLPLAAKLLVLWTVLFSAGVVVL